MGVVCRTLLGVPGSGVREEDERLAVRHEIGAVF